MESGRKRGQNGKINRAETEIVTVPLYPPPNCRTDRGLETRACTQQPELEVGKRNSVGPTVEAPWVNGCSKPEMSTGV